MGSDKCPRIQVRGHEFWLSVSGFPEPCHCVPLAGASAPSCTRPFHDSAADRAKARTRRVSTSPKIPVKTRWNIIAGASHASNAPAPTVRSHKVSRDRSTRRKASLRDRVCQRPDGGRFPLVSVLSAFVSLLKPRRTNLIPQPCLPAHNYLTAPRRRILIQSLLEHC
jgi:hypothetical protein